MTHSFSSPCVRKMLLYMVPRVLDGKAGDSLLYHFVHILKQFDDTVALSSTGS